MPNSLEIEQEKESLPTHAQAATGQGAGLTDRSMFLAAPRGILILDGETGEILEANPAARKLLHAPAAELLGKTLFHLDCFRNLADLGRVLKEPGDTTYCRYDGIFLDSKPGQHTIVDVTFHAYLVGTRKITECNLNLVTDRIRKQSRQRRTHTMAALARMAEKVAEELNALLPVITASTDLGLGSSAMMQSSYNALEEVQKARARLAALARGLMAFSGKQALRFQPVDLNHLVATMDIALCQALGEEVHLVQQLTPGLQPVKADPTALRQAILALAGFARERMSAGGEFRIGTAAIEPGDPVLRDLEAPQAAYGRLTVGDAGGALDEHTWAHFFEPFHGATAFDEHGLGLAAVYGIVKQSGGYISVSSGPAGLLFHIYLPGAQSLIAALPRAAEPRPAQETIVVFEAEEGLRHLVRNLLTRKGYKVLEAQREDQVRRFFAEAGNSIDLLMANVTAAALARSMAAARPGLKLVYISNFADDAGEAAGPPPPDAAVLQKPFRLDALLAKIRAVLDN